MLRRFVAVSVAAMLSVSVHAASSDALFSYGGKDYQLSDLQPDVQQRFFENQKEARDKNIGLVDQALLDVYVNKLAAGKNRPVADIREELLKVAPVTDAEVKELYNQYQGQIGMPFEQVLEPMRQRMEAMRIQEKAQEVIEAVKKESGFELKLAEITPPVFTMDLSPFPFKGAEDARVTVVEVADYRCPYCKTATAAVDDMLKTHGDQVKVVYVDLPVVRTESGVSQKVMAGAYCARQQNKYWEYHNEAYTMQSSLSLESPAFIADKLGLDKVAFETCMASADSGAYVVQSEEFARNYGVTGTPTFFINGQRVYSHNPSGSLNDLVEKALK